MEKGISPYVMARVEKEIEDEEKRILDEVIKKDEPLILTIWARSYNARDYLFRERVLGPEKPKIPMR